MSRAYAGIAACLVVILAVTGVAKPPDLAGYWAMIQVLPQAVALPLVGDVVRTSYVIQRVVIEQTDDRLILRDEYCRTIVEDGTNLARTVIPEAFMTALRPSARTASLELYDGVYRLVQDPYVEIRGAELASPEFDPLPTDPQDPRVLDQDQDGHPGLSIHITLLGFVEGEVYVVQRVAYSLHGDRVGRDRVEGTVAWSEEQVVLDVSNPLLRLDAPAYPLPDSSRHIFKMIRVDATWTCEQILGTWRAFFGLDPQSP